jgi:hypothetical protein
LGNLLRWVCSKELFVEEIPRMRVIAAKVVCKLEKTFPPSFFDCQVHLLVQLVDEIAIAGGCIGLKDNGSIKGLCP